MRLALPGAEKGNILLSDDTKNRISLVRFRFRDLGRLSVIFCVFCWQCEFRLALLYTA